MMKATVMTLATKDRLFTLLCVESSVGTRLLIALAGLLWGIDLLIQPEFVGSRLLYTGMALIMPEWLWGALFVLVSLLNIFVVWCRLLGSKLELYVTGFISFYWWFVVVSLYTGTSPPPPALTCELAIAIATSWVFLRTGTYNSGA